MADKAWKAVERRFARILGTCRRPLSGGRSQSGGRDDVMHPDLFVEVKYRQYQPIWNLYEQTRELAEKEGKVPLVVLAVKRKQGFVLVLHTKDIDRIQRALRPVKRKRPLRVLD